MPLPYDGCMEREIRDPQPVRIPAAAAKLDGDLTMVADSRGLVIFVHGSGSGRFSPRNRHVARVLNAYGFTTLLADLLTGEEEIEDERSAALRFNIPLLAERTIAMIDWARSQNEIKTLPIGLFGASTGAAAAIIAAVDRPREIGAIVSRGGRVDLAGDALEGCRAPLLMIVGGNDETVERLHRISIPRLECENRLTIIPGATHLFEEPGTLDRVAELAAEWFSLKLRRHHGAESSVLQ